MGGSEKQAQPEQFSRYVVIPSEVFFSPDIRPRDKLLYGLLSCMSNAKGYAYPRNATLQKYLGGVSEDTVARSLRALEAAGAIEIVNGSGGCGTIRKIYVGEVHPVNPRKNAEVNPRKNAGVNSSNNITSKKTKKAPAELCSADEIREWLDLWVARLELDAKDSVALCRDIHSFLENRAAKCKPVLTIEAAKRRSDDLTRCGKAYPARPAAVMRWALGNAIDHNWDVIYPPDDRDAEAFGRWLADNYPDAAGQESREDYF